MTPEALYAELGRLIASMPDLKVRVLTADHHRWLGRAHALLNQGGHLASAVEVQGAIDHIIRYGPHSSELADRYVDAAVARITSALHRALAAAELEAPVAAQGSFIPAGSSFDAFAALAKVLGTASSDLLIIDPYMDEKALTNFAPLAAERVSIRLLADRQSHKATLRPAQTHWNSQYGQGRPLEVRLAPSRTLHDRAVLVDSTAAWTLTQSLNAFATRSPAMIVRVDDETAALKISAYEAMWAAATPL